MAVRMIILSAWLFAAGCLAAENSPTTNTDPATAVAVKDACSRTDGPSIATCAESVLEEKRSELEALENFTLSKIKEKVNKDRFHNDQKAWQQYLDATLHFYKENHENMAGSRYLNAAHLIYVETTLVDQRIHLLRCMDAEPPCSL